MGFVNLDEVLEEARIQRQMDATGVSEFRRDVADLYEDLGVLVNLPEISDGAEIYFFGTDETPLGLITVLETLTKSEWKKTSKNIKGKRDFGKKNLIKDESLFEVGMFSIIRGESHIQMMNYLDRMTTAEYDTRFNTRKRIGDLELEGREPVPGDPRIYEAMVSDILIVHDGHNLILPYEPGNLENALAVQAFKNEGAIGIANAETNEFYYLI